MDLCTALALTFCGRPLHIIDDHDLGVAASLALMRVVESPEHVWTWNMLAGVQAEVRRRYGPRSQA